LQASAANTSFMTGLGSAYIYSGGATINNNGFAITIAQPLLAPTGNGVNGIASFTGGAGYIAPPIVTVTNGVGDTTGVGATAIAQINPLTGVVANIVITSPGVNYTATPTFILSGGGATTPATITGAVPTANTSGGLTTTGSGILTLSGANTYTGNTTVNGGTLVLNQATLATNSTVTVASGAVLQLGFSVTNRVASLVLNGVSQAPGVYNSTTGSPYITGSGSLLVPAAGPSGPAYLTNSVSGGHLNLSWPAGQSWRLEMQTNSVATGLSTNWTDVTPGTASSTNIPINVSQPTVFYRLIYP
jgi:autotransporter-associated beta strand protein